MNNELEIGSGRGLISDIFWAFIRRDSGTSIVVPALNYLSTMP
jgi:hypothetical protein